MAGLGNPTAAWVIQQLREAFPYDTARKYLIFDRDAIRVDGWRRRPFSTPLISKPSWASTDPRRPLPT